MESTIIRKAKTDLKETQEAIQKIEQAKIKVMQDQGRSERLLPTLHDTRGKTLASMVLGKAELQSDLERIEGEIKSHELDIERYKPCIEALEELMKVEYRKAHGPRQILNRFARYERMKKYHAETPSTTGEHDLRVIAEGLGMINDLEDFLTTLQQTA